MPYGRQQFFVDTSVSTIYYAEMLYYNGIDFGFSRESRPISGLDMRSRVSLVKSGIRL